MGRCGGQLGHICPFINRGCRHATGAAEITDLGNDIRICNKFFGDQNGFLGIAPAVGNLKYDLFAVNAAHAVDPIHHHGNRSLKIVAVFSPVTG